MLALKLVKLQTNSKANININNCELESKVCTHTDAGNYFIFYRFFRILQINNYSHNFLLNYCTYILINPALIKHLIDTNSVEILQQFKDIEMCNRIYSTLSVPEKVNKFLQDKDLNQSIGFLGKLNFLFEYYIFKIFFFFFKY
jgi:hypothetical protein